MLSRLTIQNYAIIDSLNLSLSGKLNVITGETGAGKSILVGALGLILGERADGTVLVNKEKKCVVEGIFTNSITEAVKNFLTENELDQSDELVIRREIGTNGKSRAFINDTPVNLSQLQALSSLLVDLHQQFDTLSIHDSEFQREVLDALAAHGPVVTAYRQLYGQWDENSKQLSALKQQAAQFEKEADFNRFQFNELEEASFKENELEELETELKMLSHAGEIRATLANAYYAMEESDQPLVQQVKSVANQLHPFTDQHPSLSILVARLQSAQVELQDIASELSNLGDKISLDPEKAEIMQERLSLGYKLQKKHGVQSTQGLLEVHSELEQKLKAVLEIDETIRLKEKEGGKLQNELLTLAERISVARNKQVRPLEEKVNSLLVQVGMPNARLKIAIEKTGMQASGMDKIDYLFNANIPSGEKAKTASFQPIGKVASGGELSRLMLCIKSLVAQSIDLPTLIFDEIDTGISGEAARQVAIIMKELALCRQVVCITHQPQIAGKADTHFFVYKDIEDDKVVTHIRELNTEERINAIARMLSGEKPTAAAMQNAREMVLN